MNINTIGMCYDEKYLNYYENIFMSISQKYNVIVFLCEEIYENYKKNYKDVKEKLNFLLKNHDFYVTTKNLISLYKTNFRILTNDEWCKWLLLFTENNYIPSECFRESKFLKNNKPVSIFVPITQPIFRTEKIYVFNTNKHINNLRKMKIADYVIVDHFVPIIKSHVNHIIKHFKGNVLKNLIELFENVPYSSYKLIKIKSQNNLINRILQKYTYYNIIEKYMNDQNIYIFDGTKLDLIEHKYKNIVLRYLINSGLSYKYFIKSRILNPEL